MDKATKSWYQTKCFQQLGRVTTEGSSFIVGEGETREEIVVKDEHTQRTTESVWPKALGAQRVFLDITALIRSIQLAEGNADCFRTGQVACDQVRCAWRQYCLGGSPALDEKGI
jgi:hypothetical protein